jgi:hypothetical protein
VHSVVLEKILKKLIKGVKWSGGLSQSRSRGRRRSMSRINWIKMNVYYNSDVKVGGMKKICFHIQKGGGRQPSVVGADRK